MTTHQNVSSSNTLERNTYRFGASQEETIEVENTERKIRELELMHHIKTQEPM